MPGQELGSNNFNLKSSSSESLELVFLGTGNAFSMANRYWGSILVNKSILLDASPIVVPHMKSLGLDLTRLEHIFITHFYADHFFGLPFILLDYAYLSASQQTLTIIGPTGVEDKIRQVTNMGFSSVFDKLRDKLKINYFDVTSAGDYSVGLNFHAQPMDHGAAEAYGYRFKIKGKTIGYTGDTDLCDGLYELAKGAHILIIEMSNPNEDVPGHLNLTKLQTLREHVAPSVKIILNHVGPIADTLPVHDNVILPKDFEVMKF